MGDSKEQNGSFNMAIIDVKRKLLDLKREQCLNESIDKCDLMINIVWNDTFVRIDKNRKAIADRGWGSNSRNIRTFSHIRTTMIESNHLKDMKYHIVLSPSSPVCDIINNLFSDNLFPSISLCSL